MALGEGGGDFYCRKVISGLWDNVWMKFTTILRRSLCVLYYTERNNCNYYVPVLCRTVIGAVRTFGGDLGNSEAVNVLLVWGVNIVLCLVIVKILN